MGKKATRTVKSSVAENRTKLKLNTEKICEINNDSTISAQHPLHEPRARSRSTSRPRPACEPNNQTMLHENKSRKRKLTDLKEENEKATSGYCAGSTKSRSENATEPKKCKKAAGTPKSLKTATKNCVGPSEETSPKQQKKSTVKARNKNAKNDSKPEGKRNLILESQVNAQSQCISKDFARLGSEGSRFQSVSPDVSRSRSKHSVKNTDPKSSKTGDQPKAKTTVMPRSKTSTNCSKKSLDLTSTKIASPLVEDKKDDSFLSLDPMAMLMRMEGSLQNDQCQLQPMKNEPSSSPSSLREPSLSQTQSPAQSKVKSLKSRPVKKPRSEIKKRRITQVEASTDELKDSGSELSDWEEVIDHTKEAGSSQVPDRSVEITLEIPDLLRHKKRKRKEFDWKGYLERRVRRFKKEVAIDMHKVHLLCLLSLGLRQNEELNDLTLSGLVLSMLPTRLSEIVSADGVERRVELLLQWYKKTYSLEEVRHCSSIKLVQSAVIENCIKDGRITDARVWVLVFICILRAVGLSTRLVLSFQAMPFKGSQADTSTKPETSGKKKEKVTKGSSSKPVEPSTSNKGRCTESSPGGGAQRQKSSESKNREPVPNKKGGRTKTVPTKEGKQSDTAVSKKGKGSSKLEGKRRLSSRVSSHEASKHLKEDEGQSETGEDEADSGAEGKVTKPKKTTKKKPKGVMELELSERVLSSSSSDGETTTVNRSKIAGHDFWLEIFFPVRRKWVCFDCFKGQFGKPYSLENSASQPLAYVIAYKNDGGVKDVTPRYAKLWLSQTRKQRVDQDWWEQTLAPFSTTPFKDDVLEDDEIKGQLLARPMPTSIADFKSHPLYALRRHLLKFESIYPDTAIPVGYIKKEPVYARECVHTLHARDNWLKEGRLVRIGEEPYKMVKSRPKWNKPKENPDELDLELYGEWQTEKYIPPPAINGKVPKNDYGNLELFQPWMLPLGTVQLKVNGLQRVAKKLNIDVAPAMVGWDHHSGHSHPVFDGVVVCEEFADTLMAAWHEDQEIQQQRETEKREKRVYTNWKQLIKGMLIKARLEQKFMQDDLPQGSQMEKKLIKIEALKQQQDREEQEEETKPSTGHAADVPQAWPLRQQTELKAQRMKDMSGRIKSENLRSTSSTSQDSATKPGKPPSKGVVKKSTSKGPNRSVGASKGTNKRSARKGRTAEDKVDSGEGSSDEEDVYKKEVVEKVSRPKRRSVAAVKYVEKDGDEDEDETNEFADDSDHDPDFDMKDELKKNASAFNDKSVLFNDKSSRNTNIERVNTDVASKVQNTIGGLVSGPSSTLCLSDEDSSSDEDG